MVQTIPLITPSIVQWEEAGVSLANALAKYLDLCTSLGTKSLEEGARPNDLVERIDSKLTSLHSAMDEQVAQARSALSETRNNIASPMHRLPEEVLAEIFAHVIYSPNSFICDGVTDMEVHLLKIYRWVYRLLAVCSRWQQVVLGQGHFWSMIPIYRARKSVNVESQDLYNKHRQAMLVSLERAQGRCLDMAVVLGPDFPREKFDILKEYLPRIRSINILASRPDHIRCVMDTILPSPNLDSLLELSIYQKRADEFYRRPPQEQDCVYYDLCSIARFNRLLRSVPVLRIGGAHMHWDTFAFSDRLTKLRLQAINFGTDRAMIDCLRDSLASATGLRELELVSIQSLYSTPEILTRLSAEIAPISFSNLESLLIDDLYWNTLLSLLNAIVSGPRRLILRLTGHSRYMNFPEVPGQTAGFFRLLPRRALKRLSVHTLCIHGAFRLTPKEFGKLIGSVPKLNTLLLDWTELTTEHCNALKRPASLANEPNSSHFPSFQYLHFTRVLIKDMAAFKSMVASHSQSMKQLVLGCYMPTFIFSLPDLGTYRSRPGGAEAERSKIISDFKEIVPDFRLIDYEHVPPEFQRDLWRLW